MRFTNRLRLAAIALAMLVLVSANTGSGMGGGIALAANGDQRAQDQQPVDMSTSQHEMALQTENNDTCVECQQPDPEAYPKYPIMKPSPVTLGTWMDDLRSLPEADISPLDVFRMKQSSETTGTSLSLLDHLDYIPAERDQGYCGNCWVWAGTGAMAIAIDIQNGIKDRLSIQYLNSKYNGGSGDEWACCGGTIPVFADFYNETGMAIPWSNTNAHWQDGDRGCSDGTSVPAATISSVPNYPIMSIKAQMIPTTGEGEAMAIDNIKAVLHRGTAIPFCYYMPERDDWESFFTFWDENPETETWNPDYSCGQTWDSGGGHAVLCVGYNDDPGDDNDYWVMLNSWGTADGRRPNGLFRVDMHMNYDCQFEGPDDRWSYSFQWPILDVTFTDYTFEDPRRGTELYINAHDKLFRLTSPDGYDSGVVEAKYMRVLDLPGGESIYISHWSREISLFASGMAGRKDSLLAFAIDRQKRQILWLFDPLGIE